MSGKKADQYLRIIRQIESLIYSYNNMIARMATINAILYHKKQDFFWVGFYLLSNDVLSVGPYQGPLACLELEKDKGVCWTCIRQKSVIIIPDVKVFPGHIACDPRSKSEIALPLIDKNGSVTGVLDIDSRKTDFFDDTDAKYLEKIVSLIYD